MWTFAIAWVACSMEVEPPARPPPPRTLAETEDDEPGPSVVEDAPRGPFPDAVDGDVTLLGAHPTCPELVVELWVEPLPTEPSAPVDGEDADGDGHVAPVDCDDRDPSVHPGARERCDGVDTDCDPNTGEEGLISIEGGATYTDLQAALKDRTTAETLSLCGEWSTDGLWLTGQIHGFGGAGLRVRDGGHIVLHDDVRVEGLTFSRDGPADEPLLKVTGCERATLVDVRVEGTEAGAVLARDAHLVLVDSDLVGNQAEQGAAVHATHSTIQLVRTHVTGNGAATDGGGLYLEGSRVVADAATVVAANSAHHGGGLYLGTQSVFAGGAVVSNDADFGGGVFAHADRQHLHPNWGQTFAWRPVGCWISDTLIERNAASFGGGLAGRLRIDRGIVRDNVAALVSGDAVFVAPDSTTPGDQIVARGVQWGSDSEIRSGEHLTTYTGREDVGCDGIAPCHILAAPDPEAWPVGATVTDLQANERHVVVAASIPYALTWDGAGWTAAQIPLEDVTHIALHEDELAATTDDRLHLLAFQDGAWVELAQFPLDDPAIALRRSADMVVPVGTDVSFLRDGNDWVSVEEPPYGDGMGFAGEQWIRRDIYLYWSFYDDLDGYELDEGLRWRMQWRVDLLTDHYLWLPSAWGQKQVPQWEAPFTHPLIGHPDGVWLARYPGGRGHREWSFVPIHAEGPTDWTVLPNEGVAQHAAALGSTFAVLYSDEVQDGSLGVVHVFDGASDPTPQLFARAGQPPGVMATHIALTSDAVWMISQNEGLLVRLPR